MKPSEILLAAREKIAARGGWTQGTYARDRRGNVARADSPAACSWCLFGALDASGGGGFNGRAEQIVTRCLDGGGISTWNDAEGRTHLEVVELLERAALLAMSEGQ